MRFLRVAILAPLLVVACSSEPTATTGQAESGLARSFSEVAARNGVPRDLLVAIAVTEEGLDMPPRREIDPDAVIAVAGPLQLRRGKFDSLKRGAELVGVSELELRKDDALALEAGARVVAELGARTSARADDLASWSAALEELSGYADAPHRVDYAHRVFAVLASGGVFPTADERIELSPHALPGGLLSKVELPKLGVPEGIALDDPHAVDYPGAEWIPTSCTNKCTPGRAGNPVKFVIIHDTEGGWDASVATLQNDPGKSVHYIIGVDGRLAQFVNETVTAWHGGNFYYNQRSVGIEHVGYSTKPYPEKEYVKSAELLSYLTKKYAIAKDRSHVIGHDQIPNGSKISESAGPCMDSPKACESNLSYGGAGHHTDPGVWEWCTFMPRFGGACKCNDIWELWNCSSDRTKAFRCVGGKIELAICDGPGACEVKPLGTADVCHKATTPPPDAGTPDTGARDTGIADVGTTDGGAVEAGVADGSAGTADAVGADAERDDGGAVPADEGRLSAWPYATGGSGAGCSTGAGASGSGVFALFAALAAMAVTRRRRRLSALSSSS